MALRLRVTTRWSGTDLGLQGALQELHPGPSRHGLSVSTAALGVLGRRRTQCPAGPHRLRLPAGLPRCLPHVLRHGRLLLPLHPAHGLRAQQPGPPRCHPERVRGRPRRPCPAAFLLCLSPGILRRCPQTQEPLNPGGRGTGSGASGYAPVLHVDRKLRKGPQDA